MQKNNCFIIRVKFFFINKGESLLRAIDFALEVWDFIQQFIIPLF